MINIINNKNKKNLSVTIHIEADLNEDIWVTT